MEDILVNIYDDKGNFKSLEQFLNDSAAVWKQLKDKAKKDENKDSTTEEKENGEETESETEAAADTSEIFLSSLSKLDFSTEVILDKIHFLERQIYINQDLNEDVGQMVLQRIQMWNREDDCNDTPIKERLPIKIYIDSDGGLLSTAFQIVDVIKASKTPVITINTGTAYSGAFLILIAGDERWALPHSSFMFHEGSATHTGDAHKVIQQEKFYQTMLKQIRNLVLKSTKISPQCYAEHKKDDWYFGVNQALKLGVIDEVCKEI